MLRLFSIFLLSVGLFACMPLEPYQQRYFSNTQAGGGFARQFNPNPINANLRNYVEVEDNPFERSIIFKGVERTHDVPLFRTPNTYFIRSWVSRVSGGVHHQLYVTHYYRGGGWKFWRRANARGGQKLEFVNIDRSVLSCRGGCSYSEIFGIGIDDVILQENRLTGFQVQIGAKNGERKIISVTSDQIEAQLAKIDFVIEKSKSKAGS